MTRAELCELAADPLVTIGSHTVVHAHLLEVGSLRAAAELTDSKAELEDILERPIDQFSYPFGARNPSLDTLAQALGYGRLFSTSPQPVRDTTELVAGRVSVDPDISPLEFRLKLMGAYRWLARTS
jgi:peptidoglycan/xylan/chitin deacetylase (PgdA/CDA1 family)